MPKDGKDLSVRELEEALGRNVEWDKGDGKGKSIITITTVSGDKNELREGEDYYIGGDGKAYYYNNVRALLKRQDREAEFIPGRNGEPSTITVKKLLGAFIQTLTEGIRYYIGADGKAYYHNNVRAILEAQNKKVIFTQGESKGESTIKVTTALGALVQTLKEGEDYYIGQDGKAHFTKGTVPPGGEKPGSTPAQTVTPQPSPQTPAQSSDMGFIWPLPADANVTAWNSFDEKGSAHPDHLHRGEDFSTKEGTDVYAIADGAVLTVGFDNSRGNYIYIKHDESGYFSVYQHLKEVFVSKSTRITQGQTIGTVGNTGNSGGAHLHIEIIQNPPSHDKPGDTPYYGPDIHPLPYHKNPNELLPVPSSVEQKQ